MVDTSNMKDRITKYQDPYCLLFLTADFGEVFALSGMPLKSVLLHCL